MRKTARNIFAAALQNASISAAFARHVHCERGILRISEDLFDLNSYTRVFVVSIGKAAHTMVAALVSQTGTRLEGIVASPVEVESQLHGFRYFRGGHPLPTADSIRPADAILKSLRALDAASLIIFLISGGASSIVEKPIDDEISLDDLIATYRALVHSGAPIAEINAIRKHLSAVKGGRLAQAAYPAQQVSILVSDVPDNTPDALASGPTMPDSTSIHDCETIAAKYNLLDQFPASTANLFRDHALEETPKSDDPSFVRARWWTILSNKVALDEAAKAAQAAGFRVEIDNTCDDWGYEKAADYLVNRLRALRTNNSEDTNNSDGAPLKLSFGLSGNSPTPRTSPNQDSRGMCLLSGGEVTVTARNGGTGGRNQQFALACAEKIAGDNITVLSAGTDGIDGNSPSAGAIVDGTTVERAGGVMSVRDALARFDAHPLLTRLGDDITIGPTGNNLRDLRILLAN